jgi:outer membrane protein OmpA-like peptidoglycan-associated protein
MSGFLGKLTRGGLGSVVESWLGKGEPMDVSAEQIESAMGGGIINSLASKLGLASGPVGMAVSYMLPKVVSMLTPDGVAPESIPAGIANYINDDEQITAETEVKTQSQQQNYTPRPESDHEESGFNWWWLLLLPLFLLLGWCTLQQSEEPQVTTSEVSEPVVPERVTPVEPVTVIPSIDPSLSISNEADTFTVSGTVADDATKDSIFDMLKSIVGADKVNGDIQVDPAAKEATWLSKLSAILPALKDVPGAKLLLKGNDVTLDGDMEQGVIDGLMEKLKSIFSGEGFNINSLALPSITKAVEETVNNASEGADAIKDMAASSSVTGESLVKALNIAGINFATGSYNIAPNSMVVLRDAAEAIKVAPTDTNIQVGGHTDNTGTSAINTKLSGQRAQVVVDTLVGMGVDASILSAKGYGDSQPIADNSSEKGRAQNRRMEFTLQ